MMKSRILALLLIAATAAGAGITAHATPPSCDANNPPQASKTQDIAGFDGITGHYVVPDDGQPTALVVMFHGYQNDSSSWICHMYQAAAHNALAFGLDYRGTGYTTPGTARGWFVNEGANDSIALAKYFLSQYPTIKTVVSFGVSMGGNASGLAVSRGAKRADGSPLFDYWVDVEGATSLIETYAEATAVGPANVYADEARADIERECGGTPVAQPACYLDLTVLTHTADIAAGGLKGAYMSHGIDDGLVPHDQSEEMAQALRVAGVPVDYYAVARRNDWQNGATAGTEGGTTLTQNAGDPLFANLGLGTYPRPLAGHGWEGSDTQLVIATGFNALWGLLDHNVVPANHEFVVDSDLGTTRIV
jgi:pimeloyl-ACP methyl ester carboxylesterase